MRTLQEITVKGVKALINRGRFAMAHRAIDRILALGPNNIAMLKLRGLLYAQEGRFEDETKVWLQIIDIYDEDMDAYNYFQHLEYEERVNFYFSDYLPNGGRRFLTQPQSVLHASVLGVLGCLVFLLFHTWGNYYRVLALPAVSISLFTVFVLIPWVSIVVVYLRSLREVTLTREGIRFATKLRHIFLRWEEIASIYVTHSVSSYSCSLTMIFQPKRASKEAIELNLNRESTAIKARSFFVREVFRHFPKPKYVERDHLNLRRPKAISF